VHKVQEIFKNIGMKAVLIEFTYDAVDWSYWAQNMIQW